MDENKLKVHVLGGFSITYGEQPISFGNRMTKATKLLQLLIYHGNKGMARETVIEELYGREDISDVGNNLRVTIYRLKKMLIEAGLPQYEYIVGQRGIYKWDAPMETEVDAHVFYGLLDQADDTIEKSEKIEILKKACRMYAGELLPDFSGDGWILMESVSCKRRYADALRKLEAWYM